MGWMGGTFATIHFMEWKYHTEMKITLGVADHIIVVHFLLHAKNAQDSFSRLIQVPGRQI